MCVVLVPRLLNIKHVSMSLAAGLTQHAHAIDETRQVGVAGQGQHMRYRETVHSRRVHAYCNGQLKPLHSNCACERNEMHTTLQPSKPPQHPSYSAQGLLEANLALYLLQAGGKAHQFAGCSSTRPTPQGGHKQPKEEGTNWRGLSHEFSSLSHPLLRTLGGVGTRLTSEGTRGKEALVVER